jgi:predicted lipoprotein
VIRGLVVVALMLAFASPVVAQDEVLASTDPYWVVVDGIERVIRPGFAVLAEEADGLVSDVTALCATPSEAALAAAQEQFGVVAVARARVAFLRFGPLTEENRAERLYFWPDRKGIALRQVQEILAEADESATSLQTLTDKSVAVQGLGALEYALFGTGAEALAAGDDFRCRYARTVAEAIAALGDELSAAWADPDGIAKRLSEPSEQDADYRNMTEALEELIGVMAHGLEAVRDQELLPFLGREGEGPKPRSAPLWRSGMTMRSVSAAFAGIEELFLKGHVASCLAPECATIGTDAQALFDRMGELEAVVDMPVEALLAVPEKNAAADELVSLSSELQTVIGERLPAALSLSTGFSSLDGD